MENQPKKRRRVERGRSKNGCLTCLTKRVKCDEKRPDCARCVRLGLECLWVREQVSLASRRRGLGPIKERGSWEPPPIVPKGPEPEPSPELQLSIVSDDGIQLPETLEADNVLNVSNDDGTDDSAVIQFSQDDGVLSADNASVIEGLALPEDVNSLAIPEFDQSNFNHTLILFPTPSFNLLSILPSYSFTHPPTAAPSIGSNDVQAMTFHSTILASMKSTRRASLSSHSIFLNFAVQNPMALHFLLAFSHSELAIHHGFSHKPPMESHLHFQQGSALFDQALVNMTPTDHVAMMLSFLYLYMFWMRRDPFDVERLGELSCSALAYVTMFSLDEMCAGSQAGSESSTLARILTYIYDRDVFCGFFGCGEKFAGYVNEKHETRERIWQLSRMPVLAEHVPDTGQRRIVNVYFSLITIQYEINQYSQSSGRMPGKWVEMKRKLDKIREEHSWLFILSQQSTPNPPLMALVTVTILHALQIYLYRSRDSAFGETPVPPEVETALTDLVAVAYHTITIGPVQLLERFQWALLIAGIETHDPIHRDWISASISDPVIKSVYHQVLAAKGMSDTVSMEAVRDLISRKPQSTE
ncbi:hypothetical protein LB507_009349 [Fusarium sp. FIESC RH6]|nr:hypothetical protein LB507_009349 [Fusarium sp. FIESC RH6]